MKQTLKERWKMNSKIKIQDKNGSLVKSVSCFFGKNQTELKNSKRLENKSRKKKTHEQCQK